MVSNAIPIIFNPGFFPPFLRFHVSKLLPPILDPGPNQNPFFSQEGNCKPPVFFNFNGPKPQKMFFFFFFEGFFPAVHWLFQHPLRFSTPYHWQGATVINARTEAQRVEG